MITYKNNYEELKKELDKISSGLFYKIDSAIKNRKEVNYADEEDRYVLSDIQLSGDILSFIFENCKKDISLNEYQLNESKSVPQEFYVSSIKQPNEYFVIIFGA